MIVVLKYSDRTQLPKVLELARLGSADKVHDSICIYHAES